MNRDSLELNTPGIFRFYGLYLLAVASFLLSIYVFSIDFVNLGQLAERFFPILVSSYFFLALVVSILAIRRTRLRSQYRVTLYFCDIALICGLIYSSGGLEQGLAIVLLVSVLFANLALPRLFGLLVASWATIGILVVAIALSQQSISVNPLSVGAFGSSYFLIAILLQSLKNRLFMTIDLAEEQSRHLAKYQQLNDLIVDRMSIGILVLNERKEVLLNNLAARRLLGVEEDSAFVSPPKALIDKYQEWLSSGLDLWTAIDLVENGIPLDLHIRSLEIGDHMEAVIFIEDSAEVKERVQDLKLRSLGQLTASIAHEIRNPLGAISHAAQLLGEIGNIPSEDEKLIRIINTNTTRINELIESILALARRKKTESRAFDLVSWLYTYTEQKRESGCKIALKVPSRSDIEAVFDKLHLSQVLDNLIENARQHSPKEEPRLCLELTEDRSYQRFMLSFTDDGPGVPEKNLEHLFEPFFTTRSSGVGLGLYLCRELCEANQAHIRYVPNPHGACFQIVLPRLANRQGRSS